MSRCCICLASGRGHFDLLISTVSSARQSLTYCHLGQRVSLSITAVTTCMLLAPPLIMPTCRPNMPASVEPDYTQHLMPIIASNQQIIDRRLREVFLITSYQHLLNCWTSKKSHDRGDKSSGVSRPSGSFRAICSHFVSFGFWLAWTLALCKFTAFEIQGVGGVKELQHQSSKAQPI